MPEAVGRARFFRSWPRLSRVLLVLASLLSTCLLLEGGLRLWPPPWLAERMRVVAHGHGSLDYIRGLQAVVRMDAGEFAGFAPGARVLIEHAEFSTVATIDALGARVVRADGLDNGMAPVLPVLGDSFAFGIGVEDAEAFVSPLQRALPQWRLINLGVMGTALDFQRRYLSRRHAALGAPATALFCMFLGNDYNDLLHRRARWAQGDGGGAAQVGPPGGSDPEAVAAGTLRRTLRALNRRLLLWGVHDSYAFQFMRRPLLALLQRGHQGDMVDPVFELMAGDADALRQRAEAVLAQEVAALRADAKRLGYRPIFALIPDVHQVDDRRRTLKAEYYGLDPAQLRVRAPNQIAARVLEAAGIPFIDGTDALRAAPDVAALYFVYDTHLTAAGHARLAAAISDPLRALLRAAQAERPEQADQARGPQDG